MIKLAPIYSLAALLLSALFATNAQAVSPPATPLPDCVYVAGVPTAGACPAFSEYLTGTATGTLTAGGSVAVRTSPNIPVCDSWNAYTLIWAPSNCYAEVAAPQVLGCATTGVLNANDTVFREMPCPQALYKATAGLPNPLFTIRRPDGNTDPYGGARCGAIPDYHTFVLGAYATDTAAIWRNRGPHALDCEVIFNGPRPNGLYARTWVKIRVGINRAATPDIANGVSKYAELYVPIDGDLRGVSDVEMAATGSLTEVNWNAGRLFATYKATVTNFGGEDASNVDVTVKFPQLIIVQSVSNANCLMPGNGLNPNPSTILPAGGTATCRWPTIASGHSVDFEFVARIANATDLAALQQGEKLQNFASDPQGVLFKVKSSNDFDATNNQILAKVDIPFRSGSYVETRAAMDVLAPYFTYTTDKYLKTCNVYKDDIFARLQLIRADHPELFAGLSYGTITSGGYLAGGMAAGHVGVVVYVKGTNFRQTGIIINGTPIRSPLNTVSEIGPNDPGNGFGFGGWTGINGLYLRTPANKFPGKPQQEAEANLGFEGRYPDNGPEFTLGAATPTEPAASDPVACPYTPNAVAIATQSPVEIVVTSSSGKHVQTKDGEIITQELGTGIHSMAFPHEDGTFAWTLVLPPDDYDVKLVGTRAGPYTLTLTTFGADGEPVDVVTQGFTNPDQVDDYQLEAPEPVVVIPTPPVPTPPVPTPPAPGGNEGNGSVSGGGRAGGGAFDGWMLLGLLGLAASTATRASRGRRSSASARR